MIKYLVRINIDKEKYFKLLKEGKIASYYQIKNWDGVSPIYGAGKCYSLRFTQKIEAAMQYNRESDAYNYCSHCTDSCYSPDIPIIDAEVVAFEVVMKEREISRRYVPKR